MAQIQDFLMPIIQSGAIIVLAAYCLGYVIKKWTPDEVIENKLIPTLNLIFGALLGLFLTTAFGDVGPIHRIIYGAFCGLAASPIYDYIVAPWAEKLKKGED